MMKLLFVTLLLPFSAFSQTGTIVKADLFDGSVAHQNYTKNPSCRYNTANITKSDASNTIARSTVLGLDNGTMCVLGHEGTGDTWTFETNNMSGVDTAGNCEVSFTYFGDATNLYAYAINASSLTTTKVALKEASSPIKHTINIPCGGTYGSNSAAPKLVLEAISGASAGVRVARVYSGRATNLVQVNSESDWEAYTPSWTAVSTQPSIGNGTVLGYWRKAGPDCLFRIQVISGTTTTYGTGDWIFGLPPQCPASAANNIAKLGDASVYNHAPPFNTFTGSVRMWSTTSVKIGGTGVANWGQGVPTTLTAIANNDIQITGQYKVTGWSTEQTAVSIPCLTNGECENTFSALIASNGAVSRENVDWINGDASIASTSNFTINFKSGLFAAAPNCTANVLDTTTTVAAGAKVMTVSLSQVTVNTFYSTTAANYVAQPYSFILTCTRSGADYRPKVPAPILTGSVTSNGVNSLRDDTATLNCDASSSITSDPSSMVSSIANAVDNGSNRSCVVTLASGAFSTTPHKCDAQIIGTTPAASSVVLTSATSVTVHGPDADFNFTLNCKGPR